MDLGDQGNKRRPQIQFMDLPLDIHMEIASFLSYPDALALKHTCRGLYYTVYTGVDLKVDWLVERFEHKLECPMEECSFRTDEVFCNWRIRRIMERRRRHEECRRIPGGCWVVEGRTCKKDLMPSWLKLKGQSTEGLSRPAFAGAREAMMVVLLAVFLQLVYLLAQRALVPQFAMLVHGS